MSKPQPADLEAGVAVDTAAAVVAVKPPPPSGAGKAATAEATADNKIGTDAGAEKKQKKVAEEEDPRLRWAFVRKVYCILALQFAVTTGIAAAACFVPAVPRFFLKGRPAAVWPVFLAILLSPLIAVWPMVKYRERHPVNLVLMGIFTICCSLSIAVSASTTVGVAVLQAAILTATALVGLTLFTFWAVKRGLDFKFMRPFLFTSLLTLLVYITIQIYFPLGRVGMTIYGFMATLVFCGFIIFDTHMLLKRHTYNDYVIAAISLYLDVINLFMAQLAFTVQ